MSQQILSAKTVSDFFKIANQEYGLNLPTKFSDKSLVSSLLKTKITVTEEQEGVLYRARGDPFHFKDPDLTARVTITLEASISE